MKEFLPILIFIAVMILSLMRAVRDAQRAREEQTRQLSEREELPEGREQIGPRRVVPREEGGPPRVPETLREAREIFRKELFPGEAPVEEEPKTSPREAAFPSEALIPEERVVIEEKISASIAEELRKGEKRPPVPKPLVSMVPVPAVPMRAELREHAKLPFKGSDIVRGIIYHEVLGTPLGFRDLPGS